MAAASLRCLVHLLLLASVAYGKVVPRSADPEEVPTEAPHERAHAVLPDIHHDAPVNPLPSSTGDFDKIPCSTNTNCTSSVMGPDSICHGIYCTCNDESYLSESSHKCLRETTTLGAGCEEDLQCKRRLGDSVKCDKYYCTCIPTAKVIKGQCWVQKLLTSSCTKSEECMGGDDSSCVDETCVCNIGKVNDATNTKCLPKAHNINDPCEEAIQCTENMGDHSNCQNSRCICLEGNHFKNNVCMKNLILDEKCGPNVDGECYLQHSFGIDHVECKDVCHCKGDLVPTSDKQKCVDKDSGKDGQGGGADSLHPVFTTFVTIILARILSS